MKLNYALDDLRKIVRNIHKISGYTISIWDTNLCQLVCEPSLMADFCVHIKNSTEGRRRCFTSDCHIINEARRKRALCVHRCHAGLVDAAVPIINDGNILGFIMYGQLVEPEDEKISFPMVWDSIKDLGIEEEALREAFGKIRYIDEDGVSAIGELINFCISYIVSQKLITVENNVLADYITSFIESNLRDDLSVSALCKQFGISKNTLYKVSHDYYGTTILDYITGKRIDAACAMLKDRNNSISDVCDAIGISDYNYFFKLFKRYMGVSPRKYRSGIDSFVSTTLTAGEDFTINSDN